MPEHNAAHTDKDQLVDWREPAKLLTLQESAFFDAVRNQGIPHYRINPRVIRFRMSEVEKWLESRRIGGAE